MKRSILFRVLLCAILLLYVLLMPSVLAQGLHTDYYSTLFQPKIPEWEGTLTLYHIVSARTFQGSVTYFLQTQAEAFEKKNRGIHIEVIGMDASEYAERVENGRLPDAVSFFAGQIPAGQLAQLSIPLPVLREGLVANACAIPYLFSANVLVRGMDYAETDMQVALTAGDLEIDVFSAARLSLSGALPSAASFAEGRASQAYMDLGEYGRLLRSASIPEGKLSCPDTFTASVCYLGAMKDTNTEQLAALSKFFDWMLSESAQKSVVQLGAFSVRADIHSVYATAALHEVDASYTSLQSVDPFLWNANVSALYIDAAQAVAGDSNAAVRFAERMRLVLLP